MSINESPRIPDHRLNDNASRSSSSSSSSTAQLSIKAPPRQIRRIKTVSQLTRWVSKRMSRSSLDGHAYGTELSEKNLNDLNLAITMGVDDGSETNVCSNSVKPLLPTSHNKSFDTIQEHSAETSPESTPEKAQEVRLRKSYAAFCEEFTLSGPQRPKRKFDISMGMGETEDEYTNDTQPIIDAKKSPSEQIPSENQPIEHKVMNGSAQDTTIAYESNFPTPGGTASFSYLRPPPQIMTPSVYQDMQRATRERKLARTQRVLGPLRSFFPKGQRLRGHRLDIEA